MTAPVEADAEAVTEADDDIGEAEDAVDAAEDDAGPGTPGKRKRWSAVRDPMVLGLIVVVALSALFGWIGFQSYQSRQAQNENDQFVQAARQAALNLTTIDWRHADDDVKRIMDSAAGEFHDDFAQRSSPFVEVVKQAQSVSVGTVTEAALESYSATEAQALVAVSVKVSSATGSEPVPRAWRMRISVQKVDDQMKVSRVEFVP
ncbi:mammalian cell entry protein [Mycobacterium hodleri]|uniref:Mammalian cell entry protein n=2 Tax=Mycolicibacterium hodleri TaxID=49897 RepID=A0A502EJ52_9MYCO|nr:mammalian cell entry protein [Mycolicibacterium hodleri]